MSTRDDFKEVMDLVVSGKLKPVMDKTFPLKDAALAQERLWKGENFGLQRDSVLLKKQNLEKEFLKWTQEDVSRKSKYGNLLSDLQRTYSESNR